MAQSKRRPKSIFMAQRRAWAAVMRAKAVVLRADRKFQAALTEARNLMHETQRWEQEDRDLREKFIALCESERAYAARKEMAAVTRIRKKVEVQISDEAQRVPHLRRLLLKPRLRLPIPLGRQRSESESPP